MKAYLRPSVCTATTDMATTTTRTIKTGNQEVRFAVANIVRSVDNNKTTVCHLAIPREVSCLLYGGNWKAMAISLSQGGLKIPRRKEMVARARKIMQEKIKQSRNCPFERLEWSVFSKIHLFHELERIKSCIPIIRMFHKLERVCYW